MVQKQCEAFHTFLWDFFPSLKQNFIAYRSSKVSSSPDYIFEIHQLWQAGFSRVYSNCCYSCSFEPEIIKIGQSSYKMYSNKILNFQESTTILKACTKIVWKLIECTTYFVKKNLLNISRLYLSFLTCFVFVFCCLFVCLFGGAFFIFDFSGFLQIYCSFMVLVFSILAESQMHSFCTRHKYYKSGYCFCSLLKFNAVSTKSLKSDLKRDKKELWRRWHLSSHLLN